MTEVRILAKFRIADEPNGKSAYLMVGEDEMLPIIFGRSNDFDYRYKAIKMELRCCEGTFIEFSKSRYSDEIREKANNRSLTVDDLVHEFGDRMSITIFAFGNDHLTGARKMFTSPVYGEKEIRDGEFIPWYLELSINQRRPILITKRKAQEYVSMFENERVPVIDNILHWEEDFITEE